MINDDTTLGELKAILDEKGIDFLHLFVPIRDNMNRSWVAQAASRNHSLPICGTNPDLTVAINKAVERFEEYWTEDVSTRSARVPEGGTGTWRSAALAGSADR